MRKGIIHFMIRSTLAILFIVIFSFSFTSIIKIDADGEAISSQTVKNAEDEFASGTNKSFNSKIKVSTLYEDGYYGNLLRSGESVKITVCYSNPDTKTVPVKIQFDLIKRQNEQVVYSVSEIQSIGSKQTNCCRMDINLPKDIKSYIIRIYLYNSKTNALLSSPIELSNEYTGYGSSYDNAPLIDYSYSVHGEISTANQREFVRFYVPKDGYYEIKSTGIDTFSDLYIKETLGDVHRTLISQKGISTMNSWSYELKSGEAYTLMIYSASGDMGKYSLTIEKNDNLLQPESIYTQHNAPVLTDAMTPIYWDEKGTIIKTVENDPNWYNYHQLVNHWANIQLKDGSMFVWIPRYAYRIERYSDDEYPFNNDEVIDFTSISTGRDLASEIEIKYLAGSGNIAYDGTVCKTADDETLAGGDWIVCPAFFKGDQSLEGFWIAKFEASSLEGGEYGGGNNPEKTIQFKPDSPSWRNINVDNIITATLRMNTGSQYGLSESEAEVHVLKNSEWAAAYLTYSMGGNVGVELNWNPQFYTGGGDYLNNINQSSTRNPYGIYDMAGGSEEFVAAYNYNYKTDGGRQWLSLLELPPEYSDRLSYLSESNPGQAMDEVKEINADYLRDFWGAYEVLPLRGGDCQSWYDGGMFRFMGYYMGNPEPNVSWRAAIWTPNSGKENTLQAEKNQSYIELSQSDDMLINPYQGIMPCANGSIEQDPTTVVTAILYWSEIEPVKGEIDFDFIEGYGEKPGARLGTMKLDYWRKLGVSVVIRIVMEASGTSEPAGIPTWLYNEMEAEKAGSAGIWYPLEDNGTTKTLQPNYANPKLIEAHDSLIKGLAERYNDDPLISYIQLGSIGQSGEWNACGFDGYVLPFPNFETSTKYIESYVKYFTKKYLLTRGGKNETLLYETGIYNDGIGHDGTFIHWEKISEGSAASMNTDEAFDEKIVCVYPDINNENPVGMFYDLFQSSSPNFWKTRPMIGEFSTLYDLVGNSVSYFSDRFLDNTIKQIKRTHLSIVGTGWIPGYTENITEMLKVFGPRLWVSGIKTEETLTAGSSNELSLRWSNSGSSPFYFDWDVEISLINSSGQISWSTLTNPSISKCLPGYNYLQHAVLDLPDNLPSGEYSIALSIRSPYKDEYSQKGLRLANRVEGDSYSLDFRYPIYSVTVQNDFCD